MLRNKLRILVIDESREFRDYLSRVIENDPTLTVVGGCEMRDASSLVRQLTPDVITLEPGPEEAWEFERVKALISEMKEHAVIVSAHTNTRQALTNLGVRDFLDKPGDSRSFEQFELRLKLSLKTQDPASKHPARQPHSSRATVKAEAAERVIVMGASLGGTEVILRILQAMPETLPGIVIVQHMPADFTAAYAKRLNESSALSVREAVDGDRVLAGTALIAPGGRQLRLKLVGNGYCVRLGEPEKYGGFCPSVDVLFRSAAVAGENVVAVILTGMGHDGAQGIAELHERGAYTIGQSRESCAVFGMPAAAEALGGVDEMLSVEEIINVLCKLR